MRETNLAGAARTQANGNPYDRSQFNLVEGEAQQRSIVEGC